ncbi:pyridoxamine 5'-phosphate oxidase family protein [Sphingorhabdus sp. M41]|uniref:pyridoxamine 5'-phosphate oxidase family protein n=1 Tax=Sphingorhabdus sp. M41 TaxID=1806885 RepID=UPI000A98AC20|nr:pyridoxamine 5'-phosphate oxidase family protein [Sphingorhabdus sp. M41]
MSNKDMNQTSDHDDIREEFWESVADSPFVMIGLDGDRQHSIPMRAQLDKDANSAIWFYTSRDNRLAKGGPAMMQFVSKGHDLFACVSGNLTEETDPAIIDKHWSKPVEAWYEQGRQDPSLLMLRLDLADAEIWEADPGVVGMFKMMTGMTMNGDEMGDHAKVPL